MKRGIALVIPWNTRPWLRTFFGESVTVILIVVFLLFTASKMIESPAYLAALAMLVTAISIMIIDLRTALFLFLIFLFSYEEFNLSSTAAFKQLGSTTSVVAVQVFGLTLMDVSIAVFVLALAIREMYESRKRGYWKILPLDLYFLPLLVLWLFAAITGLFHFLKWSNYTWELKDLGYVVAFYFLASRIFRRPRDYTRIVIMFLVIIFSKSIFFIIRYNMGGGLFSGYEYRRLFMGSDIPFVAMGLLIWVGTYFIYRTDSRRLRFAMLALTGYFTVLVVASLGRATMVLSSVTLIVIFVLFRKEVGIRTVITALVFLVSGILVFYNFILSEGNRELIAYVLQSSFNWFDAVVLYSDMSIGQRVLSAINIWETLSREGAWLWGLGWGAPWYEIAIKHPLDMSSFGLMEQFTGVHTSAHFDPVHFLLKVGILGVLVIYGTFFRFWRKGILLVKQQVKRIDTWTVLAYFIMFSVIMFNFMYYTRLKFLMGLTFAAFAVYDARTPRHA